MKLKQLGKEINVVFNSFVLYKFFVCCFFAVVSLFWATSTTSDQKPKGIEMLVIMLYWLFVNIVDVIGVLNYFTTLEKEVKKVVDVVEELENTVGQSNLPYKQVELLSLQVYVEDFKFAIFGCIPLDWALFHSMLAGVASYLVILHQLNTMENMIFED
ncbi:hypothetical protein FQR65_LT14320 [Abscondita terminalis]|nr:hypothetical protein FQR65_LT14320 [Abscondita terminalis]